MTGRRLRVGVFGYFGMGNIGNEGTLEAFLDYLRADHPDAEVLCLAAGPEAVTRDHGVSAVRLMTFRPGAQQAGATLTLRKALSRLWDAPRILRLVGRVDAVVVPGTGVLESALLRQPLSLPYWLFLVALGCRLRRRRFALVSIGAEAAPDRLTGFFHRWTVRLADYVSYRDEESRAVLARAGADRADAAVYPDLAFGLPPAAEAPARPGLVVLGVMAYRAGSAGVAGEEVISRYVATMAQVVGRLLDDGRTVRLVVGDVADHALAERVVQAASAGRADGARERVSASDAATLAELRGEMAGAGAVVASRFHNVICALEVAAPTVSLGYAEKNQRLLREFGLTELSQPMVAIDADLVLAQVARAVRSGPALLPRVRATLARFSAELADQERRLTKEILSRPGR